MKAIDNRIRRLQDRFCPETGQQRLWFMSVTAGELALDLGRCAEILDECGFLPKARFVIVDLCGVPDGLNAKELEQFLRKNGAQTCPGNERHGGPGAAGRPDDTGWSSQIGADWGR